MNLWMLSMTSTTKEYVKGIMKNKKAFTLVELIVVIVIIGILAFVMIPSLTGYIKKAKYSKLETEMHYVLNTTNNLINDLNSGAFKSSITPLSSTYNYRQGRTGPFYKMLNIKIIKEYFDTFYTLKENEDLFILIDVKKSNGNTTYILEDLVLITSTSTAIRYQDQIYTEYTSANEFKNLYNIIRLDSVYNKYNG